MLSWMEKVSRRLKSWKTKPRLSRRKAEISFSPRVQMLRMFRKISPLVGLSSPANMFKSVVLPEPDSPIMAVNSPCSTVKATSAKACTFAPPRRVAYIFFTCSTLSNAMSILLLGPSPFVLPPVYPLFFTNSLRPHYISDTLAYTFVSQQKIMLALLRQALYNKIVRAGVAELADAPDLGSGGRLCRFESCRPHHPANIKKIFARKSPEYRAFLLPKSRDLKILKRR